MFRSTILIITMLLSFNAHAVNPDAKIDECLEVNSYEQNYKPQIEFTNSCNRDVFIIYCDQIANSPIRSEQCGHGGINGQGDGYYVFGRNISRNDKFTVEVKGEFHYAACDGSVYVSPGTGYVSNYDHYKDDGKGGYDCREKHYPKR